ncbi:Por secretion system C-terminal sorting domain-containing protein, partial [Chitinophaga sp. CF118]|uniref:T9SS type A sorting domain-containing protein n=1 Tax=Chitinophaga sp. CF118 TaxID=1884367 RepID=UPI0008E56072
KLRPNPSSGQFSLDITVMEDVTVNYRVISLLNNQTYYSKKSTLLKGAKRTEDFNIQGLTQGIYLLVVEGPKDVKTLKLMII